MLLQSHTGRIELLPALPRAWSRGSVQGLCARGGFEVDIEWHDNRLEQAVIRSKLGGSCSIRYGDKTVQFETEVGKIYRLNGQLAR